MNKASVLKEKVNKLSEAKKFEFYVNKDERGEFEADVRDQKGKTVWEGDTEMFNELIEDGFMKNKEDLDGLAEYLIDNKILPKGAELVKAN